VVVLRHGYDTFRRGVHDELVSEGGQQAPQPLIELETASLFWHAAGYGRLEDHPEDAEHFGISIVEAMSYGAVPLVYADGGPREFIDGRNGTLWATVEELVAHSVEIMSDDELRAARARQAVSDSQRFSTDAFRASVRRLFP